MLAATDTFALPDWPQNAWYAAAYDVELGRTLLPRTIAGHRIVLYRRTDGSPVARVRAYPVHERHRFAWVWAGDPALADPDLIPDLNWNDDPEWTGDGKLIQLRCNYKLVVDNLMDLTH